MKTGLFHSIVKIESLAAILLVVTIVLVIAYQTLTKELTVDAQNSNWTTLCSDDRRHGGVSFTEDLSSSDTLSFSYTTQDTDQHSFAVFLLTPPKLEEDQADLALDLDWFTEITIRARAEGTEKQQFSLLWRRSGGAVQRHERFPCEG